MAARIILKRVIQLAADPQVVKFRGPGAEVLDFQVQHGVLVIWALEDRDGDPFEERFLIRGTGDYVEDGWAYVGTVQHDHYVWHLFREVK